MNITTNTPAGTPVTYTTHLGETRSAVYSGEHHTSSLPGRAPATRYALTVGEDTVWADTATVDFTAVGYAAYVNDEPRAPGTHPTVQAALASYRVGNPATLRIMRDFTTGYSQAADHAANLLA